MVRPGLGSGSPSDREMRTGSTPALGADRGGPIHRAKGYYDSNSGKSLPMPADAYLGSSTPSLTRGCDLWE